jgi:hypothetical protein
LYFISPAIFPQSYAVSRNKKPAHFAAAGNYQTKTNLFHSYFQPFPILWVVAISVGLAFPSGKPVSQFVFLPVSNVSDFGSLGLGVDLPSFMFYCIIDYQISGAVFAYTVTPFGFLLPHT